MLISLLNKRGGGVAPPPRNAIAGNDYGVPYTIFAMPTSHEPVGNESVIEEPAFVQPVVTVTGDLLGIAPVTAELTPSLMVYVPQLAESPLI